MTDEVTAGLPQKDTLRSPTTLHVPHPVASHQSRFFTRLYPKANNSSCRSNKVLTLRSLTLADTNILLLQLLMKAYSLELRQKIVEAYENQQGSVRDCAQRFKVSRSCMQKLLKQHQLLHT